jgi:phosphate transport system protein
MREHFTQEMELINQEILKMGVFVEENAQKAQKSLVRQDAGLAKQVIEADDKVNQMELTISDHCALVLAREQPVASDLRHIIACLKVVSDVERIGDYVVHAAKRARDLADEKYIKPLIDIPKMLELGARMLRESIDALIHADEAKARQTAELDLEMDHLNKQVYRELLALMLEDSDNIKQGTKLLFLARFLERMGDHAVNICSWAIYSATGNHGEL